MSSFFWEAQRQTRRQGVGLFVLALRATGVFDPPCGLQFAQNRYAGDQLRHNVYSRLWGEPACLRGPAWTLLGQSRVELPSSSGALRNTALVTLG